MGKTVLARDGDNRSGAPTIYWAAEPELPALQRRKPYARMFDVQLSQAGKLPFEVQHVGSYRSRRVQVDVMGIN